MKNILLGNGVTIQFGGREYLNDKIIKRAINNVNTKKFHEELYPKEIKRYLLILHEEITAIVAGDFDDCAYTKEMKRSLVRFKERYSNITANSKVHEIGFEDYFLIHFLVCHRKGIVNPEKFHITGSLRRFFIDSIYNNGKIQNLYNKFPDKFVEFLKCFDNIFTTNYDWNIEKATGKNVQYLHGAFHHLDEEYDPDSFRNKLTDSPIKTTTIIEGYDHLYSDALTSYSGEDKKLALDMAIKANLGIDKYVKGLKEKPELWSEICKWKDSDNQILINLYEAICLKIEEEKLSFKENISLENISDLNGEISILGLSPYNDNHIFEAIVNNDQLTEIEYYFYDVKEADLIKSIISNKRISFIDVKEFWNGFS